MSRLLIAGPRNCCLSRRRARWSPRAARSARNCFHDPGCVSTRTVRQRLTVARSLRSASFRSNASVLYKLRLFRGGMGIAAIA